jgi:hypothetical protein
MSMSKKSLAAPTVAPADYTDLTEAQRHTQTIQVLHKVLTTFRKGKPIDKQKVEGEAWQYLREIAGMIKEG